MDVDDFTRAQNNNWEKFKEIYDKNFQMFRENAKYSWEMIKFYTTLSSTIITVILGLVSVLFTSQDFLSMPIESKNIILFIPILLAILNIIILYVGYGNYKRECERLYERLGILMKLEQKLGFYDAKRSDIDKSTIFKNDDLYIPNRWKKDWNYDSEKDFIDIMTSSERNSYFSKTYSMFYLLVGFSIFIIIGALYFIVIVFDP